MGYSTGLAQIEATLRGSEIGNSLLREASRVYRA
jgi:hypothetical protein